MYYFHFADQVKPEMKFRYDYKTQVLKHGFEIFNVTFS